MVLSVIAVLWFQQQMMEIYTADNGFKKIHFYKNVETKKTNLLTRINTKKMYVIF